MKKIFKIIYKMIEPVVVCLLVYIYIFEFSSFKEEFLNLNPHPYIFVTLIMTLYNGRSVGLLTAIVSYFFMFYGHLELGGGPIAFIEGLTYYKIPIILISIAVIVGTFTDLKKTAIENLKKKYDESKESFFKQKEINEQLVQRNENLAYRLLEQKGTIIEFTGLISSLSTMMRDSLYTELFLIAQKFTSAHIVTIYEYDKKTDLCKIRFKTGEPRNSDYFKLMGNKHYKEAYEKREPLVYFLHDKIVTDLEVEAPIYIAPIISNNEVVAFFSVEKFTYKAGDNYNFEIFKILFGEVNKKFADKKIEAKDAYNIFMEEVHRRKEYLGYDYFSVESSDKIINLQKLEEMLQNKFDKVYTIFETENSKIRIVFENVTPEDLKAIRQELDNIEEGVKFNEI